jgi:glycosidase
MSWLEDLRVALNQAFQNPVGGRFYLVGETFAYDNQALLKSFVDPQSKLDGQFDFPLKARLCEAIFRNDGNLANLSRWMNENDQYYGPNALMSTWVGNHDIPRAIHFASGQIGDCRQGSYPGNGWSSDFQQPQNPEPYEKLFLSFAILLTNHGVPLIYYGDEIGLAGGGDPDNRRMMPWQDQSLNQHQINLRNRITKLNQIRQANKVLSRGKRITLSVEQDTWVYRMSGCGSASRDITVVINRADQSRSVSVPNGNYIDLWRDMPQSGGNLQIPARSILLLRSEPQ